MWNKFLTTNTPLFKLLRTIAQGIIGAVIAYLDVLIGSVAIPDEYRPFIVATVMAVLSPVMAQLGEKTDATINAEYYEAKGEELMYANTEVNEQLDEEEEVLQ